jgi:aspartokinase-like uncharacterized kinase
MQGSLVVKIGGSLWDRVPDLVPELRGSCALIVPGGGNFADQVREMQISDPHAAHWMAVIAMEQFGWYLSTFGLPVTDLLEIPRVTSVLLPYFPLRIHDPLPHTWDITSDTIAAWVAARLGVDLLLVKSVDGIRVGGVVQEHISNPVETEDVDPCLIPFALSHGVKVYVVNGRRPGLLGRVLRRDIHSGTTICI